MGAFVVTVEGKDYDVTAPDENTAWRWAKATHAKASMPAKATASPEESPYSPLNIAGAAVEPNLTLGSGMLAAPISGLAGLAGAALPGPEGQGAEWARNTAQTLTYQPQTEGGKTALGAISYPFEKLAEGADWAGGKATDITGSPAVGAAVNTAVQAAPMLAGARYLPATPRIMESAPVRAVTNVPRNLFGPVEGRAGRVLNDVAGDSKTSVVQALLAHQDRVPGSVATAGQAASPAGSAEFSALQEIIANRAPSKYGSAGIEGEQEAARQAAIGTIAKTPADLEAAIKARTAATAPMREANLTSANLLQGGVNGQGVSAAITKQMNTPGIRASDVAQKTLGAVRDKIKELSDKGGVIDAKNLYTIRKEVGNTINTFAKETSNWDKRMTSGLEKDIQGYIDNAIENAGGATWKDYLARYRDMSGPVNRMETGQAVSDALTSSLGTAERPTVFANLVKKAGEETSVGTGKPRTADLTSHERGIIEAVKAELARDAQYGRMAKEGAPEATRRIGAELPEAPGVGVFAPKINVMRALYNRFIGKAQEGMLHYLTEKAHDPREIARIMQNATPAQRSAIADAMMRRANVGALQDTAGQGGY